MEKLINITIKDNASFKALFDTFKSISIDNVNLKITKEKIIMRGINVCADTLLDVKLYNDYFTKYSTQDQEILVNVNVRDFCDFINRSLDTELKPNTKCTSLFRITDKDIDDIVNIYENYHIISLEKSDNFHDCYINDSKIHTINIYVNKNENIFRCNIHNCNTKFHEDYENNNDNNEHKIKLPDTTFDSMVQIAEKNAINSLLNILHQIEDVSEYVKVNILGNQIVFRTDEDFGKTFGEIDGFIISQPVKKNISGKYIIKNYMKIFKNIKNVQQVQIFMKEKYPMFINCNYCDMNILIGTSPN